MGISPYQVNQKQKHYNFLTVPPEKTRLYVWFYELINITLDPETTIHRALFNKQFGGGGEDSIVTLHRNATDNFEIIFLIAPNSISLDLLDENFQLPTDKKNLVCSAVNVLYRSDYSFTAAAVERLFRGRVQ